MLLSSYLNPGMIFLVTANVLAITHPYPPETSYTDHQQISTPSFRKRDVGVLPWKRQAPAVDPEEESEDMPADKDGSVPQGKSSSWLGNWWDDLKLNPFANDETNEEPEQGGGFFDGLFGSGEKEERPSKEKEQKQPDKSEKAPQSSGKSWFQNPFGGSNSDGASGEDNSPSAASDPGQGLSRGFDGPVGVDTHPIQPPMNPPLKSTGSGIDPALTVLDRSSRRRLSRYDAKEKQRINTLTRNRQPIPRDDPSLLVIAKPVERLRAYDARRDRQRQEKMRSDQTIKNRLLGQQGPLSTKERELLDYYNRLEEKNNPKSRILGIKDERKRLTQYTLRDKNKKMLTSKEQEQLAGFDEIEKQNPSSRILKTSDDRARLKKYNDRESQRQKNAAAKKKVQPVRGQRNKEAVNLPPKQQQAKSNQQPKKQRVASQKQANKQTTAPAAKLPSRKVRKAQRKEAAAAATATAAAQVAKAAQAEKARNNQAASTASASLAGKKAAKGPNRRQRKAQMKIYVADAARKEKADRAAEAQKRLKDKKAATSTASPAANPQTTSKLLKADPLSEQEKAKASDNMAAFANLPGLGMETPQETKNTKSPKAQKAASPAASQNNKATLAPLTIPQAKVPNTSPPTPPGTPGTAAAPVKLPDKLPLTPPETPV
ncbi:hypothetical protein PspLS_10399 [Pyricularia sp. CBS 133598]|nr:hypothetical protein PspLS_10399 [Pyricularia sp. CBS 133598]